MTNEEAYKAAWDRWGSSAFVSYDSRKYDKKYEVGRDANTLGHGASWEEALSKAGQVEK